MKKIFLSTCLIGATAIAQAQTEVAIESAWIRAMPPTQRMTAGYGTLVNHSDRVLTITGATSSLTASAELHTTVKRGDRMRMEPLPPITVAPGEQFSFEPGGPHVMLMGVSQMPTEGKTAELCFTLADSDPVCVRAPVQRQGPKDVDKRSQQH